VTQPERPCHQLASHCTLTGNHRDHHGPAHHAALHAAEGPCPIRLRLEHFDEAAPAVALYVGNEAHDLTTPRAALHAAAVLAGAAWHLLRLAAQLHATR